MNAFIEFINFLVELAEGAKNYFYCHLHFGDVNKSIKKKLIIVQFEFKYTTKSSIHVYVVVSFKFYKFNGIIMYKI